MYNKYNPHSSNLPSIQPNSYYQEFPPINTNDTNSRRTQKSRTPTPKRFPENLLKNQYLQQNKTQKTPSQSSQTELKRKFESNNEKFLKQNLQEWSQVFEYAMKALQENKQNGEEVPILMNNLQPSRSEFEWNKTNILNDLYFCFRGLNVKKVFIFGSAFTGLDFYGSDIDFHVMLSSPPSCEEISKIIFRASSLVYQQQRFKTLYRIDQARVPLLRCLHLNTNILCDVNFTNGNGLYNSNFICFVINLDNRIRELMFLLKCWSKTHGINEKCSMSSYCLIMMIIFYLQNMENSMLLSIRASQQGTTGLKTESGTWNFNYSNKLNATACNNQTTRELLEGFFEFYEKYDYMKYVISVYTGAPILRTEFEEHHDMDSYRIEVSKNKLDPLNLQIQSIIVQDGFELNLNVACKSKQKSDTFYLFIERTNTKCKLLKAESFSCMLHKILSEPIILPIDVQSKRSKNNIFFLKIFSTEADIKDCREILNLMDNTKIHGQTSVHRYFVQHAMKSVCKILEDIYLMDLKMLEPAEKCDPQNEIQNWTVQLNYDTVNSRKKMNFSREDTLLAEKALSNVKLKQKVPFDLNVQLLMHSSETINYKHLELKFENIITKKKSALSQFSTMFALNVIPGLRYYLKKELDELKRKT